MLIQKSHHDAFPRGKAWEGDRQVSALWNRLWRDHLWHFTLLLAAFLFGTLAMAGDLQRRQWTSCAFPASFEHISVEQGLSQGTVYCMLQDKQGFLWFGTDRGLNRYDGFHFQTFYQDKNNPRGLSGDRILHLLEDRRGYIWIATRNEGITILDPETMLTMPIPISKEPGGLPAMSITSFAEDREGNVWLGTEANGLYRVSHAWKMPGKPRFQTFQAVPHDPKGAPTGRIDALLFDSRGTLWIGSQVHGLGRLVSNPCNGKLAFEYFPGDPTRPDTSAPSNITTIQEDPFGLLWLGSYTGPYTFDPIKGTFHRWKRVEGETIDLSVKPVLNILRDSTGTMWLASDGGGLLKALPRSCLEDPVRFQRFVSDPKDPRSLSGNGLQCVFEDRSGVLWVSAYQGGLNKLVFHPTRIQDREKPALFQFRNNLADPSSLSGNMVSAVGEDRFGNLWIGTDGFGLNRVCPPQPGKRMRFERFREDPRHRPGSLQTDVILSIHLDNQKQLWLTSYNGGLIRMDQPSATAPPRFTHFRNDPRDPTSLADNFIRCIVDDGSGGFWVAFNNAGLNHFDPKTGKAKRYGWGEGPKVSSCGTIFRMVKDAFGTLWMATPFGLNRFNPETEEFRVYKKRRGTQSLDNAFVSTLCVDDSNTLWIGTANDGLNKMTIPPWNGPEPQFEAYGTREGLPIGNIESILPDGHGNLWLSTNRTLCRFDIQKGKAYPFTWLGELRKAEFIWNSCCISASGEMLFGSNDGLTLFHPKDITTNKIAAPIAISDFQVLNKSMPLWDRTTRRATDTETQEITLAPKDSMISFEFAALHFSAPEKNQYATMLEGLDKTWNEIGNKHSISYATLPPGNYVLRVKASNGDGLWNENGLRLKINVLPPWYKTWWLRTLLVGFLLCLVYATFRIRLRVLRHRNRILRDLLAQRTQELEAERRMLRTVLDIVPDYIYVKDRESRFLVNNQAVASNLGCSPEDVIGKTDFDFFPKDLAAQYFDDEQRVIASGEPLINREEPNYYPLTDTWGWHLTSTIPLRDFQGQVIGIVGVSRNITGHKQMEEALRESLVHQKVARQLLESQEQERKRIAAELHDDLGQNLLLANNQLLLGVRAIAQQQDPSEAIQEAMGLVFQSLQDVRDISHNLRPHQIDELGLSKSIESMVRRIAQASELDFTSTLVPADGLLSPEGEINLYRIAQECLNNIVKHSGARSLSVSLSEQKDHLLLRIADDGRGFDVQAVTKGPHSFGLMVMEERAHMLGGEFELHSEPGGGTTISAFIPTQRRQHGTPDLGPDRR